MSMKSMILFWLHAIMALTRALGTLVFPKERPSLLPLPLRTMSCMLLNSAYLVTPGSRARLLGPRKFGLSRMSLSGIVLCLQHQTGQLPQGPATSETAALRITILRSILANMDALQKEKGDEDSFTVDGVAATVHRPCLDTASDIVPVFLPSLRLVSDVLATHG